MIVTPLIRKSASLAYAGLRMPFALVESRLPEDSWVRTGLHVGLRGADSLANHLLHRPDEGSAVRSSTSPGATVEGVAVQDADAEREAIAEAVRERQPNVGELADPDLDVAEVQAQLQAKHALETREEAREALDDGRAQPNSG